MSGRKEDKERLTESNKPSKRYETTKMGVVLFVTCVAAIVSIYSLITIKISDLQFTQYFPFSEYF